MSQTLPSREDLVRRIQQLEQTLQAKETVEQVYGTPNSPNGAISNTERKPCQACQFRPGAPSSAQFHRRTPQGQIFHIGRSFGIACPRSGIPHLTREFQDWIYAKTNRWPQFEIVYDPGRDAVQRFDGGYRAVRLPGRWVIDSLFKAWSDSELALVFPVAEPVLFKKTIDRAWDENDNSSEYYRARLAVFAFLALASTHFVNLKASGYVDPEACATEAEKMLHMLTDPSLETLQASCMLVRLLFYFLF